MLDEKNIQNKICEKDKTILPIYFPPPIMYDLNHPLTLVIMLTNPNLFDWFYSNYIQINWDVDADAVTKFLIYPRKFRGLSLYEALHSFTISEKVLSIKKSEIVELMIQWINNGLYVVCHLAEYLLPGTQLYRLKRKMNHPNLFFGYNLSKKIFTLINFDEDQNFAIIDVSFEDVERAFSSYRDLFDEQFFTALDVTRFFIELVRINPEAKYTLNLEYICSQFEDYLLSKNSSIQYHYYIPNPREKVWGLKVYEEIIEYLRNFDRDNRLDIRVFRGLWDHKKIMLSRIKYFEEKQILAFEENFSKQYERNESDSHKLHLFALKYNVTKNENIRDSMVSILSNLYTRECTIIENVHNRLLEKLSSA